METKSDKELLIELRNKIASRIIECKANIAYFQLTTRKLKKVSQEMVDGRKAVDINEDSIKKDILFLKVIDEMIKKGDY